jgi:hypothetical protein
MAFPLDLDARMRLLLSVLFGHRLYKIVSRLDREQLIQDEGLLSFCRGRPWFEFVSRPGGN